MAERGNITLNSVVNRSTNLVSNEIDGDLVMLSIKNSKYYGSEVVGSRIWDLIGQPTPVVNVCDALVSEFDIDRSTCESEALTFLQRMLDEELVEAQGA